MAKFNYVWNYLSSTLSNFKYKLLGYKTYKAFLTQTGTDAPVATVIENGLGIKVEYFYDAVGTYYAEVDQSLFYTPTETETGKKIEVIITPSSSITSGDIISMSAYPVFFFVVGIESREAGTLADDILGGDFSSVIEIRVYNK